MHQRESCGAALAPNELVGNGISHIEQSRSFAIPISLVAASHESHQCNLFAQRDPPTHPAAPCSGGILGCQEDPTSDSRTSVCFPEYNPQSQQFSLTRPCGDDWLQRIRHRPQPPLPLVRSNSGAMFVVFAAASDAHAFMDWLVRAAAEQEHAFRTMRG